MATRSFSRFVEEEMGKIPHFVIFAVLEWVLIIILFLDGFLAFVANEFARFFELKIPCLLCTRIDHVLVHRNPDFYYNDSICESHKKDVSCLAFCHNHRKLSDIKKMCEGCLLSFATEKEADCDTYKSLVGILHKDLECFVEDDQQIQLSLRDDGMQLEKSNQRCSCCGKPLKVKSSYPKGKNMGAFSQAPASSPRAYPYVTTRNEESGGLELPHVQYTELKMMSENDSEHKQDVDGVNVNNQDTKLKEDAKAASMPPLIEADDLNDESNKTPNFTRGNRFFGIPLTDSNSPRWSFRTNRKSPLERTEFACDSNEGNSPFEADDAILNHLKRHVRLDRKSLMALYMELDEERSASAVAANNAMAMITRLQADKAAVQMEALQYQRMMEEQAEYDEEALQAASEMLTKREDEIKALETELEIYRDKYGCLIEDDFKVYREKYGCLLEDDFKEGRSLPIEDFQEFKSQLYSSRGGSITPPGLIEGEHNGEKGLKSHQAVSSQVEHGGGRPSESLRDLKGERAHLIGRIKKLENRHHMPENGMFSLLSSSDSVNSVDNETGIESEASLASISEIVKALEADSGFLELVCKQHEEHTEETEILTAISENLEKLRHLVMTNSEVDNA